MVKIFKGNTSCELQSPKRKGADGKEYDAWREVAAEWSLRLRNRKLWIDDEDECAIVDDAATVCLETEMKLGPGRLLELAKAEHLEVHLPAPKSFEEVTPSLIFPWEFVLSRATARYRQGAALVVTRFLEDAPADLPPPKFSKLLAFAASSPLGLSDGVDFEREYALIKESLNLTDDTAEAGVEGAQFSEQSLRDIGGGEPVIVHISGFDTHEAREGSNDEILGSSPKSATAPRRTFTARHDGFVVASGDDLMSLSPTQIAAALSHVGQMPAIVSFALFDSAAAIAPAMIRAGAQFSIGIQDYFDNAVLEDFWARLFGELSSVTSGNTAPKGADMLGAFGRALAAQLAERESYGAGLVLWSATPLCSATLKVPIRDGAESREKRKINAAGLLRSDITQYYHAGLIDVRAQPYRKINYALLHNQKPIFKEFRIRCKQGRALWDVQVEVNLYAGQEVCRYHRLVQREQSWVDLANEIKIPLTAGLLRSLRESVRSILEVKVSFDGRALHHESFPVSLLATDDWYDDKTCKEFLASFVLPRDPAVRDITVEALPNLRTIRDDPSAAFFGHGLAKRDPAFAEAQARAIWAAIGFGRNLNYIIPPPSYGPKTQRVRLPSEVLRDGRGTCLDLGLLLAACLEYVDLSPVLFLIKGHAFTGYWADQQARTRMLDRTARKTKFALEAPSDDARPWRPQPAGNGWVWKEDDYEEIFQCVMLRKLVALEATFLTSAKSYQEACVAGLQNLRSMREFDCVIDISSARQRDVTPIPLAAGKEGQHE